MKSPGLAPNSIVPNMIAQINELDHEKAVACRGLTDRELILRIGGEAGCLSAGVK